MTLKRIWIPSPNYSSRGGSGVRLIIIHTAEGATNIHDLGAWFANPSAQVSSHVGIDDQAGVVGEYVKRPNKAWTAGSANPYACQAELTGFAAWGPKEWERHPTMLDNTARWIAEECKYWGIPIKKLSASQATSGWGVCGHVDVSGPGGHWDPGPDFPWDKVIKAAQTGGHVYGPAAAPEPARLIIGSIGDDTMPPDYILKSNHPDSKGSGGFYAVYPSGLVRRLGDTEKNMLNDAYDVPVKNIDEKDPGTRLAEMDQAIRGQ